MNSIYCQPLIKKYTISILSRSFFISSICYIIAFILPVLVLVSIGYSWNNYQKTFLKPTIKYQNYQAICLLSDGKTVLYDSSFQGDNTENNNGKVFVSVGTNENQYSISIMINKNVFSCNLITYNKVKLNNIQVLTSIPFSFYHQSSQQTVFLNKIITKGKISVKSNAPLLQSSSPLTQTQYHQYGQQFSLTPNFLSFSNKNLTALITKVYEKQSYGSSSILQFDGTYQIQYQYFLQFQDLVDNIRLFVPFFMFIWIPVFFLLVLPLIRWMFNNKIYTARVEKSKVKIH